MSRHLRRWGAIYLLLVLFLASWVGQFISMMIDVGNEARQHGEQFAMDEFLPRFLSATFENWQSEWLQLILQGVVLLGMKHLIFKADAKDMEEIERKIDVLLRDRGIDPADVEREVEESI